MVPTCGSLCGNLKSPEFLNAVASCTLPGKQAKISLNLKTVMKKKARWEYFNDYLSRICFFMYSTYIKLSSTTPCRMIDSHPFLLVNSFLPLSGAVIGMWVPSIQPKTCKLSFRFCVIITNRCRFG